MKKIIKTLFVFILSMIVYNAVNAASVTISPTQKTIEPGEIVNISVGVVDAAGWNIKVTASKGTLSGTVKDADSSGTQTTKTILTPTFTANTEGTYKVTVEGDLTYDDPSSDLGISKTSVSATATITVKEPEQKPAEEPKQEEPKPEEPKNEEKPSTPSDSQTTNNTEPKKSSNNKLGMLGIRPNDFKNFKPDTKTYYITVPNDVEEVEVYAEKAKGEDKQTISGTGNVSLKIGTNTVKVVCTAEDGTTRTYTMYITREEEEQKVEEKEPEIEEEEPKEVVTTNEEELNKDEKDKVLGITNLKIVAKTENGEILESELTPAFIENIYEYQLIVPLTAKNIDITAEAEGKTVELEVMGNKNLVEDENIITVMAKVGGETKVYQINVQKVEFIEPQSALSTELIIQLAIIAGVASIVIVAIIVIIIMLVKSRKEKYRISERAITHIDNNNSDYNEK